MDTVLGFDAIAFWIVVVCTLVNLACGTLGCFLVLRRMSLIGDAISHAVLPGIAVGFLLSGSRDPLWMLGGAMVAGVITVVLMQIVQQLGKVSEDASMGVVFTSLFALGVILINVIPENVDLDPGCVLYGTVEVAWLDTVAVSSFLPIAAAQWLAQFGLDEIPRSALMTGGAAILVLGFVTLFWKELKIASFDPQLATTLGYRASLIHYLLMGMVAMVTVAAFEAVGSILVVAALIVPAATAYLLTDRLWLMLVINALVGFVSALGGRTIASHPEINSSAAGCVAVVGGLLLTLAVVFGPRHGVLSKRLSRLRLHLRIVREDVLALLWRWDERNRDQALPIPDVHAALGSGFAQWLAVRGLCSRREIERTADGLRLADGGRDHAQSLVRRHRLWEMWLSKRFGVEPERVHPSADRMEHFISDAMVRDVVEDIGFSETDPHGQPIPWRESDTQQFRLSERLRRNDSGGGGGVEDEGDEDEDEDDDDARDSE